VISLIRNHSWGSFLVVLLLLYSVHVLTLDHKQCKEKRHRGNQKTNAANPAVIKCWKEKNQEEEEEEDVVEITHNANDGSA
jgi:hypothetical protein